MHLTAVGLFYHSLGCDQMRKIDELPEHPEGVIGHCRRNDIAEKVLPLHFGGVWGGTQKPCTDAAQKATNGHGHALPGF
jgi:hypothetical protein